MKVVTNKISRFNNEPAYFVTSFFVYYCPRFR